MTKEQLLKLVSEAYDDGARFDIKFHHQDRKSEADEIADQYAEHFDTPCESYSNQGTGWHEYESGRVRLISFYKEEAKCPNCQK
jgi:hypothetical protein